MTLTIEHFINPESITTHNYSPTQLETLAVRLAEIAAGAIRGIGESAMPCYLDDILSGFLTADEIAVVKEAGLV